MGGWGYIRSHAVKGKLSYPKIKQLCSESKKGTVRISSGRSDNYTLRMTKHSNPRTGMYEECGTYLMYRTDILQYFADGTIHIVTHPSAITYSEINLYGPVTCWNDSKCKYREQRRFHPGSRWVEQEGKGWIQQEGIPIPDGELTILPDGTVMGPLIDRRKVLDKSRFAERRRILAEFRAKALARMMLDEFGDIWAVQESRRLPFRSYNDPISGWCVMLPHGSTMRRFAELLMSGEYHPNLHDIGKHVFRGPVTKDKDAAVRKACDLICKQGLLAGDEWYTEETVDHGPVEVEL